MAEPESNFKYALSTISLHANTVWWNEGRDSYRLTNLSTWLDYLRSRAAEPSAEDQSEQADLLSNRMSWSPEPLQQVDFPEASVSDPEAWLRGHAWPTAIARNFPAISTALSSSDRASLYHYNRVLEKMYEANKPYKIETIDELKLYRKISKESIKKLWAKTEQAPRRKDPSLNANVPEFYPAVLPHHVEFHSPQPYPPIADQTYHMELFPYLEQNAEPEAQWQVPQMQVYPASNPENYPVEWRGRPNPCSFANLLLLQKAQKGPLAPGAQARVGMSHQVPPPPGPSSQQRHPFQVYAGPGPHPQILLNSDFPELPTVRGNDPCAALRRPTGFNDICTCSEDASVQGGSIRMSHQVPPPPGPSSQQRHSFQVYAGPGPHPQILLNSDFPELPTVKGDSCATVRRPSSFNDICAFTEKTPEEILQLSSWLETAYPQRAAAFADLAATTSAFEEMARRFSGQPHEESQAQDDLIPTSSTCRQREEINYPATSQIPQEPRRLYRDVLTSKVEDDSETTLEGKFEELEREALEQYISSENSCEVVETGEQSPELEDPYQDLERQAVEQYDGRGDIDDSTTVLNTESSTPAIQTGPSTAQDIAKNSCEPFGPISNDSLTESPVFTSDGHEECNVIPLVESIDSSDKNSNLDKCPTMFGVFNDSHMYQSASLAWPRSADQLDYNVSSIYAKNQFSKSSFASPPAVGVHARSCGHASEEATAASSGLTSCSKDGKKVAEEASPRRKGKEWRKKGRLRCEATGDQLSCASFRSSSVPPGGRDLQLPSPVLPSPGSPPTQARSNQRSPPSLTFDGQSSAQKRKHFRSYSNVQDEKDLNLQEKGKPQYYSLRSSNSYLSYQGSQHRKIENVHQDKKEYRNQRYKILKAPGVKQASDADVKVLVSSLKIKALNFLKDVERKHLNEEKLALRELLYGGEKQKIRDQVNISTIQNTDVFKAYVKEIGALTRQHMDCIYKRVRKDILEMKNLYVAQPTMAEKRKVRYLIKKCLQLQERAEHLINVRKLPKKPLESSRKDIADTLHTIHKTMDIVYKLRDMCRDAREELDEVKMSKQSLTEVISGDVLLDVKPPAIRHRIQEEFRSLLLYLMCPRAGTVLYDRIFAKLQSPEYFYALPLDMAINNYLLLNDRLYSADILNVIQIRFLYIPGVENRNCIDYFDNCSWKRYFVIRNKLYSVNLITEESIKHPYSSDIFNVTDIEKRLHLKENNEKDWKEYTQLKNETSFQGYIPSKLDRCSCAMC